MTSSPHRSSRRLPLVLGGVVAVVAIVAGVLVATAPASQPRDLVVEYLDAIAAGDAGAANALARDGVDGSSDDLPTDSSLEAATTISDVHVEDEGTPMHSSDGAESLSFAVEYDLGGERHSADVRVEPTGGWWLWEQWRLQSSLAAEARVSVVWPLDEAEVQIASDTIDALQQPQDIPLYPAIYDATPRGGAMITLEPMEVMVTDGLAYVEIQPTVAGLSADAEETVVTAATEALDGCLVESGTVIVCDAGAILRVDGAMLPRPIWDVEGDVIITGRSVEVSDFLYLVSATVVATGTGTSGATVEERFVVTGEVVLGNITADDASAVARWTVATEATS